jgi:hypothetical protein
MSISDGVKSETVMVPKAPDGRDERGVRWEGSREENWEQSILEELLGAVRG